MSLVNDYPQIVDLLKKVRAMRTLQIDHLPGKIPYNFREMVRLEDEVDNELRKLREIGVI